MHVAFIIGGALAVTGALLYLHHRLTFKNLSQTQQSNNELSEADASDSSECCGLHITCERDSLSPVFTDTIEYFDDEELDSFIGRGADSYSDAEIEQFREILLTLMPDDIAPWARSVQQRGIVLPSVIKDELFIIVEEERAKKIVVAS